MKFVKKSNNLTVVNDILHVCNDGKMFLHHMSAKISNDPYSAMLRVLSYNDLNAYELFTPNELLMLQLKFGPPL